MSDAPVQAHYSRRNERRLILRHAGVVLVGQLAVMSFGVVDTVVAGRVSPSALAALAVGTAIYISVFIALTSVVQALLPVWAELHGARRHREMGRSIRQALYLVVAASGVGILALNHPGPLLQITHIPAGMQAEASAYLSSLAWALPPALLFRLYGTFNQSLGRARAVTLVQVAGLALKVPLSMLLAWGAGPIEPLGALGCGIATAIVNTLMLALASWWLLTDPAYRPFHIVARLEAPDWIQLRHFLRLGLPAGITVLVEVTSFTFMTLLAARLGEVAAAAHQIASNFTAVLFMTPMSIAIAASARVSFWIGAGHPHRAQRATFDSFLLVAGVAACFSAIIFILNEGVARAYSNTPEVVALAASLLLWVAAYHWVDALQVLGVYVLRCHRINIAPMITYSVLLWGLGLAGGYQLAYHGLPGIAPMQSPAAFWISSIVALCLVNLVLGYLLLRVAHQLAPPSPARGARAAAGS